MVENLHKVKCFGELKNPLLYCKETGKAYRHMRKGVREIKSIDRHGYLTVNVNGRMIKVHKIVAMEFLGHVPNGHKLVVDHIDGDKLNNRINNLQLISQRQNTQKGKLFTDKTSDLPLNVTWHKQKQKQKYKVRFMFKDKQISFGHYPTLESAILARDEIQTRIVENGEPLDGFKSKFVTAKKYS